VTLNLKLFALQLYQDSVGLGNKALNLFALRFKGPIVFYNGFRKNSFNEYNLTIDTI